MMDTSEPDTQNNYGAATSIKLHRVSANSHDLDPPGYSMTDSLLSEEEQQDRLEEKCIELRRTIRKIQRRVLKKREKMNYRALVMDQFYREYQLFLGHWKIITVALLMQYVHSIFTNIVYFAHRRGERLPDVGYIIFPELNSSAQSAGDYIFFIMMAAAIALLTSPFIYTQKSKPLFVTHILARIGAVVSICEILRCITFLSTILPSPADRCQPGSTTYDPPTAISDILFNVDAFNGCGDLIFSSHTLICLNVALMYHHYCVSKPLKGFMWIIIVILSLSVIAARHHYTVDVIVAWYVSPMVWIIYAVYYPDTPFPVLEEDLGVKQRYRSESELIEASVSSSRKNSEVSANGEENV